MDSQINENNIKIMEITEGNICNRCLGRKFSKLVEGPDNKYRGEYVRQILSENGHDVKEMDSCYICDNLFDRFENGLIENIIKKINDSDVEFSTFLIGCHVPGEILQKDENINEILDLDVENIKKEINREIGKKVSSHLPKEVDFENPEVVIIIDFIKNSNINNNSKNDIKTDIKNDLKLQINPIFIEGRYRKLLRGIPQTKWPCRKCKGKGCESCNYTGKMYQESVEEIIAEEVIKASKGSTSKFHGAGREDIDVRMLGNGRPFVLEIKEPKIRIIDLKDLENKINKHANGKVEVLNLIYVDKQRRVILKNSSKETYKIYRAVIELEEDIKEENLNLLNSIKVINQRTPIRVSHRRADKIRTRKIRKINARKISAKKLEMTIECQGGLYIKELISGDQNRTNPSVSDVLKTRAHCMKLDVLDVNI